MAKPAMLQFAPAALEKEAAAAYVALSVSTFAHLVRINEAPPPRALSEKRVGWLRAELDAWLLERPVSRQLPPPNTGAPKPKARVRSGAHSAPTAA